MELVDERLDLLGQVQEQFVCSFSNEQVIWDSALLLLEGEGGVASEMDRAHSEVGASKVSSEEHATFSSVRDRGDVCWDHWETLSVFARGALQAGLERDDEVVGEDLEQLLVDDELFGDLLDSGLEGHWVVVVGYWLLVISWLYISGVSI